MTVLLAILAYIVALGLLLALVGANRRAGRRMARQALMPKPAGAMPDEDLTRASNVASLRPKRAAAAHTRDAIGS